VGSSFVTWCLALVLWSRVGLDSGSPRGLANGGSWSASLVPAAPPRGLVHGLKSWFLRAPPRGLVHGLLGFNGGSSHCAQGKGTCSFFFW
jgi:hypothetical protein